MSRLIEEIDKALSIPQRANDQAVLLARKGCYFSRIGRFDEARQLIAYLRSEYGRGQDASVSIWIMLLEGILYLYSDINIAAYDRIKRAQFLSIAISNKELISITSAWKAHLEFENSNFDAMIQSLMLASDSADSKNHDAHSRLAIVLCNALYLCGDRERAQLWFMRSRSHAVDAGDQATIEALLYNRSAFGMAHLRSQACIAAVEPDEIESVRHEMASARNFQDMTGITALHHLIGLCEARILMLEGSYLKAIVGLQSSRLTKPFASYNFDQRLIDLELAFCHAKIGRINESMLIVDASSDSNFDSLDLDEQLVACWLKYQLCKMSPHFGDSEVSLEKLNILRASYTQHRDTIHGKLIQLHNRIS